MDKINVIIPIFNCDSYIERCVNSVLTQSYRNFEIICVDDGSADDSCLLIDQLAFLDNRIVVVHKQHVGVSHSRNCALKMSTGEEITFIDADDWIDSDLFEMQVKRLHENDADVVACRFVKDYNDNHHEEMWDFQSRRLDQNEALDCSSPYYFTAVGGKIYKRCVVANLEFDENIYYGEDTLFYTQVLFNSKSVYWDNAPYYHYCANLNQATAQFDLHSMERRVTSYDAMMKICALYKNTDIELYKGAICRAEQKVSDLRNKMLRSGLNKKIEYRQYYQKIRRFIYTPRFLIWYCRWDIESKRSKIKKLLIYPIINWINQKRKSEKTKIK